MLEILQIMFILFLAVPLGYLLAYLTRDELVDGRKYFKLISFLCSLMALIFLFFSLTIALTLVFMSIVSSVSLVKSYDKKFIK